MKTCRACGRDLPLEDFYLAGHRSDGREWRRATCRYCRAARLGMAPPRRRRVRSRLNAQGEIHCGRCGRWLPRDAFLRTPGPLPSYCLSCRRDYQRERHRRRQDGDPAAD